MVMKRILFSVLAVSVFLLSACGVRNSQPLPSASPQPSPLAQKKEEPAATVEPVSDEPSVVLLYQGHASLRITAGDHVIYIDPYAGSGYDSPADLILITHGHYDHNNPDLIQQKKDSCRTITWTDALQDGTHQSFDLGYVVIDSVEAGNNVNHSTAECVGYVLRFADGPSVYVSGDTSKTDEMASLKEKKIDYAFFCCDGVYNMNAEEASECAALVQAEVSIPYHVSPADPANSFDMETAERFQAEGRRILKPGEELVLK